jgi:putative membrane protein (TIGR04086 family)
MDRRATVFALLKGLGVAVLTTLIGMAVLAAVVVLSGISDSTVLAINQALKAISIALGAAAAVGFGGRRGFVLGAVVGALYMILGYALYCAIDGRMAPAGLLVTEFLMGALVGALAGALVANISPPRRLKRRTRTAA